MPLSPPMMIMSSPYLYKDTLHPVTIKYALVLLYGGHQRNRHLLRSAHVNMCTWAQYMRLLKYSAGLLYFRLFFPQWRHLRFIYCSGYAPIFGTGPDSG